MLDQIIAFSLRNRLAIIVAGALLLAIGANTARQMPVDVFPDLTAPTVTVLAEARGMAPSELETLATFPIESSLNGAPGVRRVRSSTAVGLAIVWIEFEWGTDVWRARQLVGEKLALVAASFPPDIDPPVLGPVTSLMGEIMFVAIASERHDPTEVRSYAETEVRRRLLSIPGVAQVTPIGAGAKQYQVVVDPLKLRRFRVSLAEVEAALAKTNENASAGFVADGGSELLVELRGRVQTPAQIGDTLVAMRDDRPVRVRELGEVRIGEALKRGDASAMGRRATVLGIQKQPGADTVALTEAIEGRLDEIQKRLPEGYRIERGLFRQADFIQVSIDNVALALRDGAILVVLVVGAFLVSGRATLIALLAIPLSLAAAVLALQALGATLNTMTLGGFAISIGALVDDAVIDVENVVRRLRENVHLPPAERRTVLAVVLSASSEIRGSIVFATLIIALVFVPLFFLTGVEGRLLAPLGFAYIVALMASLAVALTVTPALCALLLPRSRTVLGAHEPLLVRVLKRGYGVFLRPSLRHPWALAGVSVALLAGAIFVASRAGRSFLPEFHEGTLTIAATTLPGTSLAESDRLAAVVEEILLEQPEVTKVSRKTGRAELDEHTQGVESSELDVTLDLPAGRAKDDFLADLRAQLAQAPGMSIVIGQPISHRIDHMLSGTRASIAVKLFGDDLSKLRATADRVRQVMAEVPGVVDLATEALTEVPFLRVRIDRDACARYGVHVRDVASQLRTALIGTAVSQVLEGRNAFDLVVRVKGGETATPEEVAVLPIDTDRGGRVPLRALAQVVRERGPNAIGREGLERKLVVMSNVAGRDVISVVDDIRARLESAGTIPAGVRVEFGGQFESAKSAQRTLLLTGILVLAGIFVLLYAALGTGRDALLVMVNLPLALVGGVAGVWLTTNTISIAEIIGFITLLGIATRNGLMLVTHVKHLREEEGVTDFAEAVERGALERLAPILMTALAAGLALVPLALGGGKPGNEIQTPMAIVILSGLASSTFLNMIVVPALYLRFGPRGLRPKVDRWASAVPSGHGRGDGGQGDGPGGGSGRSSAPAPALVGLLVAAALALALGSAGCAGAQAHAQGVHGGRQDAAGAPASAAARPVRPAGDAPTPPPAPAAAPPAVQLPRGPLDLAALEAYALAHHPALDARGAEHDAATALRAQAGAWPNPRLELGSEINRSLNLGRSGEHYAALGVTIPWGGRIGAGERAAAAFALARAEDLEAARREVLLAVRVAFAEALAAERALAAARDLHEAARGSAALVRSRFAAGDARESDLAVLEVEEGRARLSVDAAMAARAAALAGLAAAAGAPGAGPEGVRGDLAPEPPPAPREALSTRLLDHPRLRAIEAAAAEAEAQADQAARERWPDLTLEGRYRRLQASEQDAFDMVAGIELPLLDRRTGAEEAARHRARAALAAVAEERLQLERALTEGLVELDRARRAAVAYRAEILPRAERAVTVADLGWRAGGHGLEPLFLARRTLAEVRQAEVAALRDAAAASARVRALTEAP